MFAYIDDLVGGSTSAQRSGFVARMLGDQLETKGEYSKPIMNPEESNMNSLQIFDYSKLYNPSAWITAIYGPENAEVVQPMQQQVAPARPPQDRDYVPPSIQTIYDNHKKQLDKYQRQALHVRFRNYYAQSASNRHKEPKAQAMLHAIYADGTKKGNVDAITRILNDNGMEYEDWQD